jgi:hypothetical protein
MEIFSDRRDPAQISQAEQREGRRWDARQCSTSPHPSNTTTRQQVNAMIVFTGSHANPTPIPSAVRRDG